MTTLNLDTTQIRNVKITVRKPRTAVIKYKPWKFGTTLIRENDGSLKLWKH